MCPVDFVLKRTPTSIQYSPRVATMWTLLTGPISIPAKTANLTSDSLKSREIVNSRHKNVISPHPSFPSSSIWWYFPAITKILEGSLFTQLCHLNSVLQNTKTRVSLLPVSRCLSLWWYQQFYISWLHSNQHFTVHRNCIWSFLFILQAELRTPVRPSSVDTELRCRKNRLKQEFRVRGFSIEVSGTFVFVFVWELIDSGQWCLWK